MFADEVRWLVHSDLHWENLLTDGTDLTGIVDFEQAQPASPDLELDVLLRFCHWPFLPVAPDYQDSLVAADFRAVPEWLAEVYPKLLSEPRLYARLEAYAVMHDLRQAIQYPERPGREYPDWWPWNRLRATLDGRSYLSTLLQRA